MTDPVLTPVAYDDFVADIAVLTHGLAESDWRPNFIVGVGRGGLVPATYLSHAASIPLLSVDHSAGVFTFGDQLLAELALKTNSDVRLLVVDDINDSGRTIGHLRDAIEGAGGIVENVRYAVLIDNVASAERVDYRARTIDRRVTKDWFVFPWEAVATREAILEDAAAVPERLA